jgi:hypothetical protein
MNRPVRPARAAVVAALVAAAYVIALYLVRPVPDWAIALFGGPDRPIDRHGGLILTFHPAPGEEAAFDAYVAARGSVTRRDGANVVVEMPGVPEAAAMETIDLLQYGGLTMKEVVRTNYAAEIGERDGLKLEVDQWMPDDGGETRTDTFLRAASADAPQEAAQWWERFQDANADERERMLMLDEEGPKKKRRRRRGKKKPVDGAPPAEHGTEES